jgi:Transcriptional activator of glycolytic enzymes
LSRNTATIPDLWREWTVGLGEQLSVEALDERWGSRWRSGSEFQFYSRRKVIITEIKQLVAGGREAMEVVNSLKEQRLRAGASLSKVINALTASPISFAASQLHNGTFFLSVPDPIFSMGLIAPRVSGSKPRLLARDRRLAPFSRTTVSRL